MTRNLLLIAGAAFLLCVVCLAGATALGGHEYLGRHWTRHWTIDWHDAPGAPAGRDDGSSGDAGQGVREIAWSGADALELEAPADVVFTQAPGPGKLTISGPKAALDRLVLEGSRLAYRDDDDNFGRLQVVMTAPDVRRFAIDGDGRIRINSYAQDDLALDVSGHGDISGAGQARNVRIDISGDGDVDLSGMKAQSAYADISGHGRAKVAPSASADLHISGAGEIDLATRPPRLVSDISGAGRIVEDSAATSPTG